MARTVGELGEFALIDRVRRIAGEAPPGRVPLGIGDDAALVRVRPGEDVVVTTDAFVEGVHFRFATHAPAGIGRRALAATLSDLAAMGARPLCCVLAFAAPPALPLRAADGIARGLAAGARAWDSPLAGGNVTRASETSLALTALGAVRRGRALRRDAGRPGDGLFVTGVLGTAALARVRAEREGGPVRRIPEPRLAAGRALARLPDRGACIDVSDGLAADLAHLARASGVGAEIDPDLLPLARGLRRAGGRLGLDPLDLALYGGEDYELLFSARGRHADARRLARRLGVPVTRIGRLTRRRGLRDARAGGRLAARGWRHFG